MLNCPTYPIYNVNACFSRLILAFGLPPLDMYIVKFTNNLGQVHKYQVQADVIGSLVLDNIVSSNDLFSPYTVEVYAFDGCDPLELSHCGTDYTKFEMKVEKVTGSITNNVVIPCCND